jgi:tetratricopeptide (TPR) repeat protein
MDDFSLNALGILCGTDKSDLGFGYLRHYERAVAGFRNLPINLIEVGVDNGASARMWKRYFSKALIVGVDIQERCKAYAEDRLKIEIGSQSDGEFLDALAAKYPPTIIIDDGSHQASDIIFTFERMFPVLLPGGCYIIEDLFFHEGDAAERNRGTASMGAQDYLLTFARQLLDGHTVPLHRGKIGERLKHQIERIEAVGRAAFIWKKADDPQGIDYPWLELLVRQSGLAKNWDLLASYVVRNNGPLVTGERAAREAIRLDESRWAYHSTLALVLERAGKLAQAAECLEQAVNLATDPWRETLIKRRQTIERRLQADRIAN